MVCPVIVYLTLDVRHQHEVYTPLYTTQNVETGGSGADRSFSYDRGRYGVLLKTNKRGFDCRWVDHVRLFLEKHKRDPVRSGLVGEAREKHGMQKSDMGAGTDQ